MKLSSLRRLSLLCVLMVCLSACSLWPFGRDHLPLPALPATWSGDVSCPGCTPHQQALTLFADGSFHLRDDYPATQRRRGKEVFFDVGRWSRVDGDASRLMLHGGNELVRQLRLQSDGHLRLLSASGDDIRSIRDYILSREKGLDPIAGPMRLLGQLSVSGRKAHFHECLTGRQMAVLHAVPEGVLKQYRVAQKLIGDEAEAPVLASVLGSFSARLGSLDESEPRGPIWQIDVLRVKRFWPGETCAMRSAAPSLPLRDTPWRVLSLADARLQPDPLAPPLTLRLHDDGQVSGHTGCNALRSRYRSDDRALTLESVMMTRRACMSANAQALEAAWIEALRATTAYRVVGSYLELQADERVLARLSANEMH